MAKNCRATYPEIERLAGRLSSTQIAQRVRVCDATVWKHLARIGVDREGPTHPAARRYAGRDLPPKPVTITEPYGAIFVDAIEHTYQETGEVFGMTKQGVARIVKLVMAALDEIA